MRIHVIQHVPFEGPASITKWAEIHNHKMTATHVYRNQFFPDPSEFECLIIMGGPMNIYEEDKYPWLAPEKKFIRQCIDTGKTVIGICLGAQLIADVMGAKVRPNEDGWFPLEITPEGLASGLFDGLSDRFTAFHWHGDTFGIPDGALRLAKSKACENQGFLYGDRVLGFQFHLESTRESVADLIKNCKGDMTKGSYVQDSRIILSFSDQDYQALNKIMFAIMDHLPVPEGIPSKNGG